MRARRVQLRFSAIGNRSETAPPLITSKENQWVKRFRAALAGDFGQPDIVGIEGPRLVEEAQHSGVEILAVLASPAGEKHIVRLGLLAPPTGSAPTIPVLRTNNRLFASIAGTESPQGIAALVRLRKYEFDDVMRGMALVVVLIGVQDPGNVGTLVRSAEALGATGMIATEGTANPFAQKALRASAGSAFRLPILIREQPLEILSQLRSAGLRLVATIAADTGLGPRRQPPRHMDFHGPIALLVGSEASGLPDPVLRMADAAARIPLAPPVESLNAATAASLILYEAARQRADAAVDERPMTVGKPKQRSDAMNRPRTESRE